MKGRRELSTTLCLLRYPGITAAIVRYAIKIIVVEWRPNQKCMGQKRMDRSLARCPHQYAMYQVSPIEVAALPVSLYSAARVNLHRPHRAI